MSLGAQLYNLVFKKSSTYILATAGALFVYERGMEQLTDTIFDSINKGKQWKDIKHLYVKKAEEQDE